MIRDVSYRSSFAVGEQDREQALATTRGVLRYLRSLHPDVILRCFTDEQGGLVRVHLYQDAVSEADRAAVRERTASDPRFLDLGGAVASLIVEPRASRIRPATWTDSDRATVPARLGAAPPARPFGPAGASGQRRACIIPPSRRAGRTAKEHTLTSAPTTAEPDAEQILWMYRRMVTIREFEEAAGRQAEQAKIPGAVHLYAGEEAVAVGVCANLDPSDTITSTHRGHGHCIAKGGDVRRMFAELYGKADGYCQGKGGSMHIADLELGILGANGIVGGGPPIGVGAAFAARYSKSGGVSVCFCGDGATNEGTWHEALNLAAVFKLPAIFVVENNHYGEFTPQERQGAIPRLSDRAAAYGIPGVTVNGMDVLAVYAATHEAAERARRGDGPSLIEADTYRFYNHTGMSEGDPRPQEERAAWRERDPIDALRGVLERRAILSGEGAELVLDEVRREIEEAVRFAEDSPDPQLSELLTDVYS